MRIHTRRCRNRGAAYGTLVVVVCLLGIRLVGAAEEGKLFEKDPQKEKEVVERGFAEARTALSKMEFGDVRRALRTIEHRVKGIRRELSRSERKSYEERVGRLEQAMQAMEDSLVEANTRILEREGREAAIEHLQQVLRRYRVSDEGIRRAEEAIMTVVPMTKEERDFEQAKEAIEQGRPVADIDDPDVREAARRLMQARIDSVRAVHLEQKREAERERELEERKLREEEQRRQAEEARRQAREEAKRRQELEKQREQEERRRRAEEARRREEQERERARLEEVEQQRQEQLRGRREEQRREEQERLEELERGRREEEAARRRREEEARRAAQRAEEQQRMEAEAQLREQERLRQEEAERREQVRTQREEQQRREQERREEAARRAREEEARRAAQRAEEERRRADAQRVEPERSPAPPAPPPSTRTASVSESSPRGEPVMSEAEIRALAGTRRVTAAERELRAQELRRHREQEEEQRRRQAEEMERGRIREMRRRLRAEEERIERLAERKKAEILRARMSKPLPDGSRGAEADMTDAERARAYTESIYEMLEQNLIETAHKTFRRNRRKIRRHSSRQEYEALKTTVSVFYEEMKQREKNR